MLYPRLSHEKLLPGVGWSGGDPCIAWNAAVNAVNEQGGQEVRPLGTLENTFIPLQEPPWERQGMQQGAAFQSGALFPRSPMLLLLGGVCVEILVWCCQGTSCHRMKVRSTAPHVFLFRPGAADSALLLSVPCRRGEGRSPPNLLAFMDLRSEGVSLNLPLALH